MESDGTDYMALKETAESTAQHLDDKMLPSDSEDQNFGRYFSNSDDRVGTSGKIFWKLRNVWKSLESLEIVWSFKCFRNFVWKMSGNLMKILYNPVFY